jgi:hypothetical protein
MAIEDSTTDISSGTEAPSLPTRSCSTNFRRRTIGYRRGSGRPKPPPELRINGHWLSQAGFPIGAKVTLLISPKRIVIELIEKSPDRPRLPRTLGRTLFSN